MNKLLKTCVALPLIATTISFTASAADAESAWAVGDSNGVPFLHMTDVSGPTVTLRCGGSAGLQAVVYLNGNTIDDLEVSTRMKVKSRLVSLDTDTTDERDGDWAYVRNQKTLISTKGWQAKRIFNAAVTGSAVEMDIRRVGDYTLTMPAMNDSFKTFVSECDAV